MYSSIFDTRTCTEYKVRYFNTNGIYVKDIKLDDGGKAQIRKDAFTGEQFAVIVKDGEQE